MNHQPAGETMRQAEHTESNGGKRRVWTIEELRKRLGVTAPASDMKVEPPKRREPETRQQPKIIRRGAAYAMA